MIKALDRILYVDDDVDIQAITLMVLESISGFTVEVCSSGAEALAKAVAFNPDLVVLDVMMPGMDGIETFSALKKFPELKNTPVAFVTAKVQPQEVQAYLQLGVVAVVAKPFDPMTLSDQLREIWRKSQC